MPCLPGNAAMASDDDGGVFMATVRFRGTTDAVPVVVAPGQDAATALRAAVAEWFGIAEVARPRLWLVVRGRRISDGDSISTLLEEEGGQTVFAGLSAPERPVPPEKESASPGGGLGAMAGALADNPELLAAMVQMDPRIRALMDKEPLVREALQDPDTLRDLLRAQGRPGTSAELMRSHDRVIANVSNMPGGMAMLHRVHAMMEDAGAAGLPRTPDLSETALKYGADRTVGSEPMPNPWHGKRTTAQSPGGHPGSPDSAAVLAMLEAMGLSSPSPKASDSSLLVPFPIDNASSRRPQRASAPSITIVPDNAASSGDMESDASRVNGSEAIAGPSTADSSHRGKDSSISPTSESRNDSSDIAESAVPLMAKRSADALPADNVDAASDVHSPKKTDRRSDRDADSSD